MSSRNKHKFKTKQEGGIICEDAERLKGKPRVARKCGNEWSSRFGALRETGCEAAASLPHHPLYEENPHISSRRL